MRAQSLEQITKFEQRRALVLRMRTDGYEWQDIIDAVSRQECRRVSKGSLLFWCRRNNISVPVSEVAMARRKRRQHTALLPDHELLCALREELRYHPEFGHFTWRRGNSRHAAGDFAGSVGIPDHVTKSMRYGAIKVFERRFLTHRLVWLFEHGEFPKMRIDHADRDTTNNRISNLRLATQAQNIMNRGALSNNRLGIKGVSTDGRGYRARISAAGKCHYLGYFNSAEDAKAAWQNAAPRIHGEFAVLDE